MQLTKISQTPKFIVILILLFPIFLNAQDLTHNTHGERIIVYPSGKWEYFDETKPLHRAILKEKLYGDEKDEQTPKGEFATMPLSAQDQIELAEEKLALAKEKENDAKFSQILLEEELDDLKNDKTASKEKIKMVENQLKLAKKLKKQASKNSKQAAKDLKKTKKKKSENKAAKLTKSKSTSKEEHQANIEKQNSTFAYQEDATFYNAAKNFKKYSIEEDVMYNPPKTTCKIAFEGIDEFLGKKRKDIERSVFFTHTEDDMRRYMKNDDYIICEGSLTQISGGVLLFNMFISINSNDALRSFGELTKGSLIIIKMLDGTKITLANNQADKGMYDSLNRRHNYTAQYLINSGQEKKLKKGEVDLVRIIWETGYEDYEVYNLDFFRDQFRCLDR